MSTPTYPVRRSKRKNGDQASAPLEELRHWFECAKKSLAGGVSSSARSVITGANPHPIYITHGFGSHIWDADDNEYIDYLLSYGSAVLGHADPALNQVLARQMACGTMFGTCNTIEVELAEQICRMVPCADLVRFANGGSEAVCGAVCAARGYTGKTKILKFEGHYHGWVDVLAISNRPTAAEAGPLEAPESIPHSPGIPRGIVDDVIICPWNDLDILRQILNQHESQLAAVICEPVVANNACIMPRPGYLEALREECDRRKIVLIFDEICTGFRLAPGGAQEYFGVIPDLACFSKAIGGGLPISAFCGRRQIMELIATNTVKHGGTYNGNPLCAAAAMHTLKALADKSVQERMRTAGETLMQSIRRAAKDNHVSCVVQGMGPMFQVLFKSDNIPLVHYRDLQSVDMNRYAAWRTAMLAEKIHVNSSGSACWFLSTAHTPEDVKVTGAAIEKAMRAVSC